MTTTYPTTEEARQEAEKLLSHFLAQGYSITELYPYTDKTGDFSHWRVRLDHPDKGKEIRPISFINGKWELKEPKFPDGKPLYNLHEITNRPDETVWIVEGEKCADALMALGILATTSGSSTSASKANWKTIQNRSANIWADNDKAGLKHQDEVTGIVHKLNCKVQWVDIDELGFADTADGSDSFDWLKDYPTASRADIEDLPLIPPIEKDAEPDQVLTGRASKAQILIELASECELFTSSDDIAYATIPVNEHHEIWDINSKGFERWLTGEFYRYTQSGINQQTFKEALSVLESKARYEGEVHPVFMRMAESEGHFYLDLANKNWEVVEITGDGWEIISNSPVKFIRSRGMLPLPTPVAGGSLESLRSFANLYNDDDYTILISYLLYSYNPRGPYPILIIQGEQGSAKSTFGRLLRALIDPSSAPLRATPKGEQDLMIAA